MCGGFTCSKNVLIALNSFYVVIGSILIWSVVYGRNTVPVVEFPVVGGILTCGVILILVSVLGLLGAVKHHQVILFFYMIIIFVLFLVQFCIACASLAVSSEQQEILAEQGWNKVDMKVKEQIQDRFDCCGFYDRRPSGNGTVDHPSCDVVDRICCNDMQVSPKCQCEACVYKLKETINNAFKTCGTLGLMFSFTELLAVWVARRYRNQADPHFKQSHAVFPSRDYIY